jgi:hypothetical protein
MTVGPYFESLNLDLLLHEHNYVFLSTRIHFLVAQLRDIVLTLRSAEPCTSPAIASV